MERRVPTLPGHRCCSADLRYLHLRGVRRSIDRTKLAQYPGRIGFRHHPLAPDKNNSTASRRNSSVYFDGRPILASFPETFSQEPVPQKMGELQTWAATRRPTGLRGDVSTEVVARRTAAPAFWSVAEPSGGPAGGRCQPSGMTCT